MLTDAHCHPRDLFERDPSALDFLFSNDIMCAANAVISADMEFNRALSRRLTEAGKPPLRLCFALHPQFPVYAADKGIGIRRAADEGLALLEQLAAAGELSAVGETGFDLFNDEFKATEKMQEELFVCHLETALRYGLPLVIHARRAMHKVFAYSKQLKRCPAVIFHSWPGSLAEAEALTRRGVNAYFSFGNTVTLNRKEQRRCCALLGASRLLTETDAPYQPPRGRDHSTFADLPEIIKTIASLRSQPAEKLQDIIAENFGRALVKNSQS